MFTDSRSFSSLATPTSPADTATGYVQAWTPWASSARLLTLFGYNSNANSQFLMLFDHPIGPALLVTSSSAAGSSFTMDTTLLQTGRRIWNLNLAGPATNRFYYLRVLTVGSLGTVSLHASLAAAQAGTQPVAPNADNENGVFVLQPDHTFVIGGANNYSLVLPVTGLWFGRGITIANSTTPVLYTAGAKDVTMLGTFSQG